MFESRLFRGLWLYASVCCGVVAASTQPAHARPMDDRASALATQAMSRDYANNDYDRARSKLRRALKRCGKRRCSPEVRSTIYRNLGVVYLAQGKTRSARSAFKRAVDLDSSGRLDSAVSTPEVNAEFKRAGGAVDEAAEEGSGEAQTSEEGATDYVDSVEAMSPRDPASKDPRPRSWLSLSVQQDTLLYDRTQPVCGRPEYTCFSGANEYKGSIWPQYGNRVSGGLALATTRVLLGFDQLIGRNFQIGVRAGFAFRGGPVLRGGEKFLPAHAELRLAYYFGSDPFLDSGVRPYLAVGGGIAEVRSRLEIDYYPDAAAYNQARKATLDAWRTSGRGFVAPSFGTQFAFARGSALNLELRWMFMLGASGHAPAVSLGFAQGF